MLKTYINGKNLHKIGKYYCYFVLLYCINFMCVYIQKNIMYPTYIHTKYVLINTCMHEFTHIHIHIHINLCTYMDNYIQEHTIYTVMYITIRLL